MQRKRYVQYNVPMTDEDDERLRDAAGGGKLGQYIREAIFDKIDREADESDNEETARERKEVF